MERYKLLIVEDSKEQAILLKRWIDQSTLPIDTYVTESMRTTINLLNDIEMDAVVLDLGLPDSSGIDTIQTIRHLEPELPIIVTTGTVEDDMLVEAKIKYKLHAFLTKPIDEILFMATITNSLMDINIPTLNVLHVENNNVKNNGYDYILDIPELHINFRKCNSIEDIKNMNFHPDIILFDREDSTHKGHIELEIQQNIPENIKYVVSRNGGTSWIRELMEPLINRRRVIKVV